MKKEEFRKIQAEVDANYQSIKYAVTRMCCSEDILEVVEMYKIAKKNLENIYNLNVEYRDI